MDFIYDSLPPDSEKYPYPDNRHIPRGFTAKDEIPSPGPYILWCSNCGIKVRVTPIADLQHWHYRGICPNCDNTWSNLYWRFRKSKNQKQSTLPDWDNGDTNPF